MDTPLSVILAEKDSNVITVSPDETVFEAAKIMNQSKVGSVLVLANGQPQGVFTERDVLTKVFVTEVDPKSTPVSAVMTRKVLTVSPKTNIGEAMAMMTEKRCRHFPVLDKGKVVGVISIGDLTHWLSKNLEIRVQDLENYISGAW